MTALVRLSSRRFALLWRLLSPAAATSLWRLRGRASRRRLLGGERDRQKRNRGQDRELTASHRILQALTARRARVRGVCRWAPRL
jgi:hypothetical protein